MDRIVDRRLPLQAPAFRAVADGGEQDPLLPKPEMDLPHALQFFELPKDERKRFAHAKVRVLLDPIVVVAHVADGDRGEELAAARLLLERFMGALAQDRRSISLIVPFMPSRSLSLGRRGS